MQAQLINATKLRESHDRARLLYSVPSTSGGTAMDAAVPSVEEDGYGDSEPEDEEEEGGADIQEDFEYWAEEGDCTRVHSLPEEEEEEDTESDACDESGTAFLRRS